MTKDLAIRFRVDLSPGCSIGIGKVELLEGIASSGSLSEAARQMRMSYRRAWLLLADLNTSFDEPVARASTGGRGGGGAVLTPFGEVMIAAYRELEAALQPLAENCFQQVQRRGSSAAAKARGTKRAVRTASRRSKPAARGR